VSDLETLRELAGGALASLELSRQRIDDLNVYPVPDGDTGTNLALTTRGIVEALEATTGADRPMLAREVTRAALMSARGNSGVILAQIVRGAAVVLGAAQTIDSTAVARAFRGASDEAYRAVRKPVEGTMLTVIRELADAAEESAGPDVEPADLLKKLVVRGDEAVARTPAQLEVLREAGVVDAGGAGLVELVRGLAATASGEPLAEPSVREEPALEAVHQEPTGSTHGPWKRSSTGSETRCSSWATPRRSRSTSTLTTRALRSRSVPTSARSRASRSPTCTVRPSSARSGCFPLSPAALRAPAWLPWSRARETAACSRISAQRR
jgi:dihydroxyacetone kinase-like predicted kinase